MKSQDVRNNKRSISTLCPLFKPTGEYGQGQEGTVAPILPTTHLEHTKTLQWNELPVYV